MKRFALQMMFVLFAALLLAGPLQAQNKGGVLFPSAARTATTLVSADQTNVGGNGVHVVLDTTAFTSGTVTLTIQGKDPASGKYYTLLAGAAVVGTSTNVYKVCKGCPVTTNISANDMLPTVWRISISGASTPISTYSVGYMVTY